MILTIAILSILLFFSTFGLFFSIKKNLQLIDLVEEIFDQMEESENILNHYLERINKKSKLEVMFDDPVVKELLVDIRESKDAIELVKKKISTTEN